MDNETAERLMETMKRCISVRCELESMLQANQERESQELSAAYNESDILALTSQLYDPM